MLGSIRCGLEWGEKVKIIDEVAMLLYNPNSVSCNFLRWLSK